MGFSISKDMDGKVLKEIFEKNSESYKRKIEYQPHVLVKEMNIISERIKELKKMGRL
jgi:hypothetical protein